MNMNIRTVLLLVMLIGIGVFAAINWGAFLAPVPLSLVVATVQAPLSLIMLGLTVLTALVALAFAAHLKTAMLLESRSHAREMQSLRKLADQAEASRLTELQRSMEAQLQQQAAAGSESRTAVLQRLDQVERNLRTSVEQGGNILAAYIGELEDRLERESSRLTPDRIR